MHPHQYAVAQFDLDASSGRTVYMPEYTASAHVCSARCRWFNVRPCRATHMQLLCVCHTSRKVHVCGDDCQSVELLPQSAGYLCQLTRTVIRSNVIQKESVLVTRVSKRGVKQMSQSGGCMMDTGVKRRMTKSVAEAKRVKGIRVAISQMIGAIFNSKSRHAYLKRVTEQLLREGHQAVQALGKQYTVATVGRAFRMIVARFGTKLCKPVELPRDVLDQLTTDFTVYFNVLVGMSDGKIASTSRMAGVYAACMCSWVSTGHPLNNPIVRKHRFFERHVPTESCFAELQIRCAPMSAFTRVFKGVVVADITEYRHGVQFAFSQKSMDLLSRLMGNEERRL